MLFAQIVVGVISLAVIATPLVIAFKEHNEGRDSEIWVWIFFLALFWVGYTGARLIHSIGGGGVS